MRIKYSSEQGLQTDQEVRKKWGPLILLLIKGSFCKANSQLLIYLFCTFNLLDASISLSRGQIF